MTALLEEARSALEACAETLEARPAKAQSSSDDLADRCRLIAWKIERQDADADAGQDETRDSLDSPDSIPPQLIAFAARDFQRTDFQRTK